MRLRGDRARCSRRRPAADDGRRARGWPRNPTPTGRQLAEAGYVAPHWPRPWGLGADPIHQLIIDDELDQGRRAPAGQPDRHRLGRPDHPLRRDRRAEGSATCGRCSAARSSGASCSPSPAAAATSPTWAPGRCATATSSSSTGRRSGRAAPSTPGSASSSPAPIPTSPSTRASRTSSARWTRPASRSARSSR